MFTPVFVNIKSLKFIRIQVCELLIEIKVKTIGTLWKPSTLPRWRKKQAVWRLKSPDWSMHRSERQLDALRILIGSIRRQSCVSPAVRDGVKQGVHSMHGTDCFSLIVCVKTFNYSNKNSVWLTNTASTTNMTLNTF